MANLLNGSGDIKETTSTGYVVAVLRGTFNFVDLATAEGTAGISVSATRFQLYADLQFRIGVSGIELKFTANGVIDISDQGLYLRVQVALEAQLSALLEVDVSGSLLIDTTGSSDPSGNGADRFTLDLNGDLTIARVITVDGPPAD